MAQALPPAVPALLPAQASCARFSRPKDCGQYCLPHKILTFAGAFPTRAAAPCASPLSGRPAGWSTAGARRRSMCVPPPCGRAPRAGGIRCPYRRSTRPRENQKARLVGQRAGEADEMLLSRGEAAAALPDGMRESIGQRVDEVQKVHLFGGLLQASRPMPWLPRRMSSSSVPVNK